jgi:hypothetical protein
VPTNHPTTQPTSGGSAAESAVVPRYEICVHGHLGRRWAARFDGLNLTNADNGTTLISGPVVDQAALHGLLAKLRDLGIPLLWVRQVPPGEHTEPPNLTSASPANNPSGGTS